MRSLGADATRRPEKWLAMEPVRLLRDYVRIDTTEGPGEERGAKFLQPIFECAGIPTEIVCPRPRRCNLIAPPSKWKRPAVPGTAGRT